MVFIFILLGLFAIGIVGITHELGHFIMAKLFKINICEFSLGIGPKIFSFVKNKVQYSLRIIPCFAYVKITEEKKEINELPITSRFFLYIGGVLFNFILGFLIFIIIGCSVGFFSDKIIIDKIYSDINSNKIELKQDDQILAINNYNLKDYEDFISFLDNKKNNILNFKIKRNNKIIYLKLRKMINIDKNKINIVFKKEKMNLFYSIKYSFFLMKKIFIEVFSSMHKLLIGTSKVDISGPIGIISLSSKFSKNISEYSLFIALLSISIGIFNLMPLFILDGGKIILLILEKIRGKKINERLENQLATFSLGIILFLLLYATFKDIIKIIGKNI